MKLLLINPPQISFPGTEEVTLSLPLGIMYLAAVLEKEGYEVAILDALAGDYAPRLQGGVRTHGMPWPELEKEIAGCRPDIVGIANPFTAQIENAVRVADIVKEIDPEILTVAGGPHASVQPRQLLEQAPSIDVAAVGEGEYTMLDIVRWREGKLPLADIPGIAYRRRGEPVLNPQRALITDLDSLPYPAYHLVDMERYLRPKRLRHRQSKFAREIPVISSRGCPYDCVFCSIHLHMGKQLRAHSAEYVVKHLRHLVDTYSIEHVHFEDDNLNLDMKRFEGILDGMLGQDMKLCWDTPNGIRADRLNRSILAKMKRSGCSELIIGIESGDQDTLDNIIGKQLKLETAVEAARLCRELDIKLFAFYVIGFPGEKLKDMEKTTKLALELMRKYDTHMSLMVATPLFGTRLYEICREKGYFAGEPSPRALAVATQYYGRGLIKTEDFNPRDIRELAASAVGAYNRLRLKRYFKKPGKLWREVIRHPGPAIAYLKSWFKLSRRNTARSYGECR